MMVIVKDAMRLPRLPPIRFEIDSGMVDDAVIVDVHQQYTDGHCNIIIRF